MEFPSKPTASTITDNELDELHDELDALYVQVEKLRVRLNIETNVRKHAQSSYAELADFLDRRWRTNG